MPKRKPPRITADTSIGTDVDLEREDIRLGDGTRLTEVVGAEIAEEAIRSVGRPSVSGARQRSPQIASRVPPAVRDQVAEIAAREARPCLS